MFDSILVYILQNLGQPTFASSLTDPYYDGTVGFYTTRAEAEAARLAAEQLHLRHWGTLDDTDFYIDTVPVQTVRLEHNTPRD